FMKPLMSSWSRVTVVLSAATRTTVPITSYSLVAELSAAFRQPATANSSNNTATPNQCQVFITTSSFGLCDWRKHYLPGEAALDFNFKVSTVANVCSGLASAFSAHPLQHRNTGWPLMIVLNGVPIDPRRLPWRMAQYFWSSARRRSAVLSLARPVFTFSSL